MLVLNHSSYQANNNFFKSILNDLENNNGSDFIQEIYEITEDVTR